MTNSNLFLKTSRNFPTEPEKLSVEINKSYLEIANATNSRTIGTFANMQTATGETWSFSAAGKQRSLRQAYQISGTGNIAHGLTLSGLTITRMYGQFTDGTNWYPLPYVDVTNVNKQVNVTLTPTNIVITGGAGAHPTVSSGVYVIEWYNN